MREDRRAKLAEVFSEVGNIYNEIVTELPEFATVKFAQTLEEEDKYFASAQGFYKIAVVGSYSTGKTTLLKSLFFDRGLYEIELPTAADITTQVPTIIKLIPNFSEKSQVKAEVITRADFIAALRWMLDQITKKIDLPRPGFEELTPQTFAGWVEKVAAPILMQPVRGGTGATQEHFLRELREAVQIFRTLDPGYRMPTINNIATALSAIKDPKASRTLRSISIAIPARNITYPIQLVDLPGMDVPNLAHRQFSYKFIAEEADAVLFIKDSQKPSFTEGEQELLTHIASKLFDIQQKCFFVFNKWHDSDHPGAEKAVRDVIQNYHFQSRNIFRISALPALMYLEEKDGRDIETKYRKSQQEWAITSYKELKHQFGEKIFTEMGVKQLKDFLEYYCENSLPVLALKNHTATLNDLLKAMTKRFEDLQKEAEEGTIIVETYEHPNLAKCKAAIDSFKENIHGIESRLDDFADSLKESLEKLIEGGRSRAMIWSGKETSNQPNGKILQLFHKLGLIRLKENAPLPVTDLPKKLQDLDIPESDVDEETVLFGDVDITSDEPMDFVPQRPVDIMTYLLKEMFPNIDVYQRVRVIKNYTAGRCKVHSHEIELAVIRDVNKALREKFREVLTGIVDHHIDTLCRTIDNEGYMDHIESILGQLNLNLYIQPHMMLAKFMTNLKTRLNEACEIMAEMAIKKLDDVGVYNHALNEVASLPCDTQDECIKKQKHLIDYLRKEYEKHLIIAFKTLSEEGWDELSEKIARGRENLVGLLGKHHIISTKIFDERHSLDRRGVPYELALFENVEHALREKLAVLKDVAKEDLEVKVTQRNSKISEYQQKIQLAVQQCKDISEDS